LLVIESANGVRNSPLTHSVDRPRRIHRLSQNKEAANATKTLTAINQEAEHKPHCDFPIILIRGEIANMTEKREDPTPEEIRKMCEKIREGWSERDEWIRRGYTDGRPKLEVTRVRNKHDGKVL
jgi:hypothetical protein